MQNGLTNLRHINTVNMMRIAQSVLDFGLVRVKSVLKCFTDCLKNSKVSQVKIFNHCINQSTVNFHLCFKINLQNKLIYKWH